MPDESLSTENPAQVALDKRIQELKGAMQNASEMNAKTKARADELKKLIGKSYVRKDGTMPNQVHTIIDYGGIALVRQGRLNGFPAHIFKVEAKNPGLIWTPVAKEFLEDFEETEAAQTTASPNEVI